MKIEIDISPGELYDRLTILEIKRDRITDPAKLQAIADELAMLKVAEAMIPLMPTGDPVLPILVMLVADLRAVNEDLFDLIDMQWTLHRLGSFGTGFAALARKVLEQNDRRAHFKRQINDRLGSTINEVKSVGAET